MREVNERRGDDHGVNLTELRSLAKRLKTQHELALQLWATGESAACTPPYAPVWIAEMVRRREAPPSRIKKAMTKARSR